MTNKMFHNEVWDYIAAFVGGSTAVLLTKIPHPFFNSSMFDDLYRGTGFILTAAIGGTVAMLGKKLGEDVYNYFKKKYFTKKSKQ